MSISIHQNTASLIAQRNLNKTQDNMKSSINRLSSGLRINSAADDAAGLAISQGMNTDLRSINQAKRNTMDAMSVIQTAESALGQTTDILTRMRELSVQANSDVLTGGQRDQLNEEFGQLQTELDNIASRTEFNGVALLDGSANLDIQVGADSSHTLNITIDDMTAGTLGVDSGSITLDNTGDPAAAQTAIDAAMDTVLNQRSALGGLMNRATSIVDNLSNTSINVDAARARIVDVDVASEMASFTKSQVLSQAGSSMLAQANSLPQMAMQLLG